MSTDNATRYIAQYEPTTHGNITPITKATPCATTTKDDTCATKTRFDETPQHGANDGTTMGYNDTSATHNKTHNNLVLLHRLRRRAYNHSKIDDMTMIVVSLIIALCLMINIHRIVGLILRLIRVEDYAYD